MAAAPELLDACIKIAEYIELHNISDGEAYFIVKNAIKKATEWEEERDQMPDLNRFG